MLDPIEKEYDQLVTELNALRIEVMQADNAVEQNERVTADVQVQLRSIDSDLRDGSFKGQDLIHAVQAKKSTEDRLAQYAEGALQLKHEQDIANHRYDLKKQEVDQVEELMAKVRTNYRYIQEKIDEERLKYTELIVNGKIIGGIDSSEEVLEVEELPALDAADVDEVQPELTAHIEHVEDEVDDELEEAAHGAVAEEDIDPFADSYDQQYEGHNTMNDDLSDEGEEQETDQEMINRFIWEDDIHEEDDAPEDIDEDASDEEEAVGRTHSNGQRPLDKPYTHYPLLVGGMQEENEAESPVEYVDNNQLELYADSASLAAYEASGEFDESEKYNKNTRENEEVKSDNSAEVFSPDASDDAPEEMDAEASKTYSEYTTGAPEYFWDDEEDEEDEEAAGLSDENEESKRTTYAWDAFEPTYPDQRETERDETVEEGAEEEDQPANATDTGEAEVVEDIPDDDENPRPPA